MHNISVNDNDKLWCSIVAEARMVLLGLARKVEG